VDDEQVRRAQSAGGEAVGGGSDGGPSVPLGELETASEDFQRTILPSERESRVSTSAGAPFRRSADPTRTLAMGASVGASMKLGGGNGGGTGSAKLI
jgi:hypothetical protein